MQHDIYGHVSRLPASAFFLSLAAQILAFGYAATNPDNLSVLPLPYRGGIISECSDVLVALLWSNRIVFGWLVWPIIVLAVAGIILCYRRNRAGLPFVFFFNVLAIAVFGIMKDSSYYILSPIEVSRACTSNAVSILTLINIPIVSLFLYFVVGNLFISGSKH
ncbi:hypothetical protein J5J10_11800 [Ciceribacter sp. L1K23]|uniref:hypothetical protein n=1 Tax=Ciceribacter sp. L1K23 TaxID=2820276 RepID=UPI001B832FB7|nr:hypothetical protein [Ciceribacter sp. L1K23]MBR0556362.1 hypothetical protein [Ciceribacter sp. L1K23]